MVEHNITQSIPPPPPSYPRDADRVCLHPADGLRIAVIPLMLESIYRISVGLAQYFDKTKIHDNSSLVFITFGLLQGAFAIWAMYISSLSQRHRFMINLFTVAFVALSSLLMIVIVIDIRTIRVQGRVRAMECATNPLLFGIGYTVQDARARCEQRNTGVKLTAVLLEGIRFVFQLLLVVVIYQFRKNALEESATAHEQLSGDQSSSSYAMTVLGSHTQAAPAYKAPPESVWHGNAMPPIETNDPSPPYRPASSALTR